MKTIRKLLAVLLALLLPCAALADTGRTWDYSLRFEMTPEAFPARQQRIAAGLAKTVNILGLDGNFTMGTAGANDHFYFDSELYVSLSGDKATAVPFHVGGVWSHYFIRSRLLGNSTLMLNIEGLLEFAMKAYNFLDIPLQYAALWVSPYVHTGAFEWVQDRWEAAGFAASGSRTIPQSTVLTFANYVAKNAEQDRTFFYWIEALAHDIGYEDDIFSAIGDARQWVLDWIAPEGITIVCEDDCETWTSGDYTLFTRTGDSWRVTLPPSLNERDLVTISCDAADDSRTWQFSVTDEAGAPLLTASAALTGISAIEGQGEAALRLSLDDEMSSVHTKLHLTLTHTGDVLTLTVLNPETGASMLRATADCKPVAFNGAVWSKDYVLALLNSGRAVNVLSVNDNTLRELLNNIKQPLLQYGLPLALKIPADTYATVLDLLEDSGILNMLSTF